VIGREILLALGLGKAFVQLCDPIPEIALGPDEAPRFFHAGFGQPGIQVAQAPFDQVGELRGDDRVDAPHVGPHGVELFWGFEACLPTFGIRRPSPLNPGLSGRPKDRDADEALGAGVRMYRLFGYLPLPPVGLATTVRKIGQSWSLTAL
jgi:hypothetical protein